MKKTLLIVVICVACISVLFGVRGFSFARAKEAIENVETSSNVILADISAISVFSFTVKDFFNGADHFEYRLMNQGDSEGNPINEWSVIYSAWKSAGIEDETGGYYQKVNEQIIPIGMNGYDEEEVQQVFDNLLYPVRPFAEWERVRYDGLFSAVLSAVQYLGYILGMVWGTISIVLLIVLDTITTAWGLILVGLAFIGLA